MFGGELGWSASLRNRNHICAGCNIFGLAGSLMPTSPAGRWSGWPRGPLGPNINIYFLIIFAGPSAHRRVGILSGWSYGQGSYFQLVLGPLQPRNFKSSNSRSHFGDPLALQGSIFWIFWPIGKASKNMIFWHRTKTSKMAEQIDPARPVSARGVQKVNF